MRDFNRRHYADNKDKRKAQVAKRRRELKKWFKEYKEGLHCTDCGDSASDNPWALEFDHIDPTEKKRTISRMVSEGRSKDSILEEIAKCEPVCSNCHRLREYNRYKSGGTNNNNRSRHPSALQDNMKRRKSEKKVKRRRVAEDYAPKDAEAPDRRRKSGPKPKPLPSTLIGDVVERYAIYDSRDDPENGDH